MIHLAAPAMNRRTLLRSSGAMLVVPSLEALGKELAEPRRILAICANSHFFPEQAGRDYML